MITGEATEMVTGWTEGTAEMVTGGTEASEEMVTGGTEGTAEMLTGGTEESVTDTDETGTEKTETDETQTGTDPIVTEDPGSEITTTTGSQTTTTAATTTTVPARTTTISPEATTSKGEIEGSGEEIVEEEEGCDKTCKILVGIFVPLGVLGIAGGLAYLFSGGSTVAPTEQDTENAARESPTASSRASSTSSHIETMA